jgi:hypothetical protein
MLLAMGRIRVGRASILCAAGLILGAGCGSSAGVSAPVPDEASRPEARENSPAQDREQDTERSDSDPHPANGPSPGGPSEVEPNVAHALATYRAALAAYNRRDFVTYFGTFADPVECFYGRAQAPLSAVREARETEDVRDFDAASGGLGVWIAEATVVSASATQIVFVDVGVVAGCTIGASGLYEKVIVMRRAATGDWRIEAETPVARTSCLDASTAAAVSATRVRGHSPRCRSTHRQCVRRCRERCEGQLADSSGCTLCWEDCSCALRECISDAEVHRTLCTCSMNYGEADGSGE